MTHQQEVRREFGSRAVDGREAAARNAMLYPHIEPSSRFSESPSADPLDAAAGLASQVAAADYASRIEGLLDDVRRAIAIDPGAAQAAALRLATLLSPPIASEPTIKRGGLAPWQKRKVERYLSASLDRPLRSEELADQVMLSVSHFCRAFKESFGTTPHTHVMRLRVALAKRLMSTTSDPLSQIACACGLADQSHLTKLFQRYVGETPHAWRRSNQIDPPAKSREERPSVSRLQGGALRHCRMEPML